MSRPRDSNGEYSKAVALPMPFGQTNAEYLSMPGDDVAIEPPSPPLERGEPTPWYLDFSGVWSRHRRALLGAAVFGVVLGYLIGAMFSTKYWTVEARLRLNNPPNLDGKVYYRPMSLFTYCDLVLSDENLEKLAEEFHEYLPPEQATKYLKAQIKAEVPRNTEMIEISMETNQPDLAVALINRLVALHIQYTNELRRTTTLRQSLGVLRQTIDRCDAQIRKLNLTIEEYKARIQAGAPLEQLGLAEMDGSFTYRRKALMDEIKNEQTRLAEQESTLAQKQGDFDRQLELHRRGVGIPFDLESARGTLRAAEKSVRLAKETVERKQEEYRNLPLEYANMRIVEQSVQLREAQADFNRLNAKLEAFGPLPPAASTDDPADEEWTRLRQRLLGNDSPEFDVLKAAAKPAYPSSSNRKVLTALGVAFPVLLAFLALGYYDHRNGLSESPQPNVEVANAANASRPFSQQESALLKLRFQQWLVDSNQIRPALPPHIDGDDLRESNRDSGSFNGDHAAS